MKKMLFIAALIGITITAQAQGAKTPGKTAEPDTTLPYLKNPTLPAFNVRLMDSVTIFNTYNIPEGKPIALFFFDPECSHCQAVMKELVKEMNTLQDIQFYLVTPVHSATALRKFYSDFHLADYKNIINAGRDYEFFFGPFYGIKYVPDLALYDSHKRLIHLFEGAISPKELRRAAAGK